MTSHASFLLSAEGPFAQAFDRFSERQSQRDMAEAVETAFEDGKKLLVEAGTGTGKTFAYLIPAIELDGRTVISTGTRNLQDQLFYKDLPLVFRVMNKTRKVALLKGRQNYLCVYRMENALQSGRFTTKETLEHILKIRDWSEKTTDGDLSQIHFLPEDSMAMPFVTSTADNCLGNDCPAYRECYVAKARKHAMDSDIIVVNHHLLMADLVLKEDGFGELLPKVNAYVIDEAHQLPDIASVFFGQHLSTRQLNELARDANLAFFSEASDCKELHELSQTLEKSTADFRLALGEESQRQFWKNYLHRPDIESAYEQLTDQLYALKNCLETQAIRSRDLENLFLRAEHLADVAQRFLTMDEQKEVQWIEVYRKSFTLNTTPLTIAESFQKAMAYHASASWVFTSATLAVNEAFQHFQQKMGLYNVETQVLSSPFNYQEQAILYAPRYLKNPSDSDYTQSFVETVLPLLTASKGRAFLLFTSHRALQKAADLLSTHREFNWFVQGTASKSFLLDEFKKAEKPVLLGTFSFWEGVDVAGDTLSFVAIDKLPFSSPGDPVNQARIDALKKAGKDAFHTFQLPDAIIALKQGAGRLIRDVNDRGVLMVADPRFIAREYGKAFRQDLPLMTTTRNRELVVEFLEHL